MAKDGTIRVWSSCEGCSIQLGDNMITYSIELGRVFTNVKKEPIQTYGTLDVDLRDVLDKIIQHARENNEQR